MAKEITTAECSRQTNHARVEGTGFCICGHAMYGSAEERNTELIRDNERLRSALRKCKSPYSGYVIRNSSDYELVMKDFWGHIQRADAVIRQTLAVSPAATYCDETTRYKPPENKNTEGR